MTITNAGLYQGVVWHTRTQRIFSAARGMMFRERPLIDGTYQWDPREGSPAATWEAADSFTKSDYARRAWRHYLELMAWNNDITQPGPCLCALYVELPPERLKNTNIQECQRCGGDCQ